VFQVNTGAVSADAPVGGLPSRTAALALDAAIKTDAVAEIDSTILARRFHGFLTVRTLFVIRILAGAREHPAGRR
jgi:hypothetical protein